MIEISSRRKCYLALKIFIVDDGVDASVDVVVDDVHSLVEERHTIVWTVAFGAITVIFNTSWTVFVATVGIIIVMAVRVVMTGTQAIAADRC